MADDDGTRLVSEALRAMVVVRLWISRGGRTPIASIDAIESALAASTEREAAIAAEWRARVSAAQSNAVINEMAICAAAYETAAKECVPGNPTFVYEIAERIRALTLSSARTALAEMIEEAREEAMKVGHAAGFRDAVEMAAKECVAEHDAQIAEKTNGPAAHALAGAHVSASLATRIRTLAVSAPAEIEPENHPGHEPTNEKDCR